MELREKCKLFIQVLFRSLKSFYKPLLPNSFNKPLQEIIMEKDALLKYSIILPISTILQCFSWGSFEKLRSRIKSKFKQSWFNIFGVIEIWFWGLKHKKKIFVKKKCLISFLCVNVIRRCIYRWKKSTPILWHSYDFSKDALEMKSKRNSKEALEVPS